MTGVEEIVLPDGTTRRLGNIMPPAGRVKLAAPHFGTTPATPLVPRAEWADRIRAVADGPDFAFLPPVHDQDGVGQCNCDDTTALIESVRMQQGLPHVELSAADLYARINGGRDQGSLLEDAMAEVMANGVGTAATSGRIWKRGDYKGPAPASERVRFKVLEAFLCPTFDHCMSAVLAGFRLSTGIMWYSNYEPDRDGWLPRGMGQAGGHAIFGYKPAMRNGVYGIWHQNSWGDRWGVGGRFVIPESAYAAGQVGGWWAVRSVTDEGGVIPTPAV
jgi:hypothetical protein